MIYNCCEVQIEISVTRVTVWHYRACWVMLSSYSSDGIFKLHWTTIMDSFSCMFFLELLHLNFNMHYFINNTLKYLHFRSRNVRLGSPIYDNDVETFGGKCQKDTDIMHDTPWCKTTFSCTGQSHGNSSRVCKNGLSWQWNGSKNC